MDIRSLLQGLITAGGIVCATSGCGGAPGADVEDPLTPLVCTGTFVKADTPVCGEYVGLACDQQTTPAALPTKGLSPAPDEPTLRSALKAAATTTAAGLASLYPVPGSGLGYDPSQAMYLDRLAKTTLALEPAERELLNKNGFYLSELHRFPSFVYGYETIYAYHLPLYVSADSILHAVHRSFDTILLSLESSVLSPEVDALLSGLRTRLAEGAGGSGDAALRAEVDVYLAVALSLLRGSVQPPVAGGSGAQIQELYGKATAADGAQLVSLFGDPREIDFSQFRPRGHYADVRMLSRYFQAMMWLGRVELRLLTFDEFGRPLPQRRSVAATLLLSGLLDATGLSRWKRIEDTLAGIMGSQDNLTVAQVPSLQSALGVRGPDEVTNLSEDQITQVLRSTAYGTQLIAAQILQAGIASTAPLPRVFLMLGQRYTADSHVLSNVVFDRVRHEGLPLRMMPDPLDAAFAALGNNQAAQILSPALSHYGYAPDLHQSRLLLEANGPGFFQGSLYGRWLDTLRTLSPDESTAAPARYGLPPLVGTEAWGRRILSTQLSSWAELRHDTLLYAKPSYTGGVLCEFPDAYVDPYPRFYEAIAQWGRQGQGVLGLWPQTQLDGMRKYLSELAGVAEMLRDIAEAQRAQQTLTQAQLTFLNQMVSFGVGCTSIERQAGWYSKLYLDKEAAMEFAPTIADVHTQPTDEAGVKVGRVLHVATGWPRLLVVTVPTCKGVRAYVGLGSSYFEQVTKNFQRSTDPEWQQYVKSCNPADPPWLDGIVAR